MQHIPTSGIAVSKLRKAAKLHARIHPEVKHAQALDAVAKEAGYADWRHVLRCTKQGIEHTERIATMTARSEAIKVQWQRINKEMEDHELEKKLQWETHLAQAIAWLQSEHSDKTRGETPLVRILRHPDTGSLLDFENYGQRGDTELLTEQDFGKVWWLKLPLSDNLYFHVLGLTNGAAGELICELHYG